MSDYLASNQAYWAQGYDAENVESFVFRWYGRIFRHKSGHSSGQNLNLLDFGCGSGAALRFFSQKGFNIHGVDIGPADIERAKGRNLAFKDQIKLIEPKPSATNSFFGVKFDVVTACQSLYYFDDADFSEAVQCLYNQMNPGGLFFATMIGASSYFYDCSKDVGNGLRSVAISNDRFQLSDYYIRIVESYDQLKTSFSLFEPVSVGFYDADYGEGSEFHYMFTGRKPA